MFKKICRIALMVLYLLVSFMELCLAAVGLYFMSQYVDLNSAHSVAGMTMCLSAIVAGIGTDLVLYKTFRELGAI